MFEGCEIAFRVDLVQHVCNSMTHENDTITQTELAA